MAHFKVLNLPFTKIIQNWGLEFCKEYESDRTFKHKTHFASFPENISKIVDNFFSEKNLGCVGSAVFFIRNENNIDNTIHIDSTAAEIYNASIIFPIRGCKSTYQCWYGGDYTIGNYKTTAHGPVSAGFRPITWNSKPNLVDKVEILEYPVLSKINLPHTATCATEQRVTLSVRFRKNYTFEEISNALADFEF